MKIWSFYFRFFLGIVCTFSFLVRSLCFCNYLLRVFVIIINTVQLSFLTPFLFLLLFISLFIFIPIFIIVYSQYPYYFLSPFLSPLLLFIFSAYPKPGKPPKTKYDLDVQDASVLHWQFLFEALKHICVDRGPKGVFIFQQSCGSGGMWLWLKVSKIRSCHHCYLALSLDICLPLS